MAHSHDRNLVQSLGIETDHKTPEHDLAVLYLQRNAQALAAKFLPLPKKREFLTAVQSEHLERILKSHKFCENCIIKTAIEWNRYGRSEQNQTISGSDEATSVCIVGTTLEHQITKGEGKFQALIGFLDLVINAEITGTRSYRPGVYEFERRCDPTGRHRDIYLEWKTNPHSESISVQYDGRQHHDFGMSFREVVVEVKTRPIPLGDAIRQFSLYRKHHQAHVWVFATTVPLDVSYRDALENEDIRTLLISEDYKTVKQERAEMDTL